jgi:drug/metabolite transporter (DMT)-like permease
VRGKHSVKNVPIFVSAAWQMLIGGIVVLITGFAMGEGSRITYTPRTVLAVAYLTVFGSIVAYSAYVYAIVKLKTTTVSLYAYVNPIVAVLLGYLVLREQLTPRSVAAMLIILAGVALVQTASYARKSVVAPEVVAPNAEKNAA